MVEEWLASIGMNEYLSAFVDNGFDSMSLVNEHLCTHQLLTQIGICKLGHRLHILRALKATTKEISEQVQSDCKTDSNSLRAIPSNSKAYFNQDVANNGSREVSVFFKLNMVYLVE